MVLGILSLRDVPSGLSALSLSALDASLGPSLGLLVGRPPWIVDAVQNGTSVAVAFGMWFNNSNAVAAAATARTLVTSTWPGGASSLVTNTIASSARGALGATPSGVDYSSSCGFASSTLSCDTSITLDISTGVAPPATLVTTICTALGMTSCGMVTLLSSSGPSTTGTYISSVQIQTVQPAAVLSSFLTKARSASQLSLLSIVLIQAYGVTVFTIGDLSAHTYAGSVSQCIGQQWYLLFLILLAPVGYIVVRYCYHRGKVRGVDIARDQFEDLKVKTNNTLAMQQQQQFQMQPQMVYYEQPQYADGAGGYGVVSQEMYAPQQGGVQQPQI